MTFDSERPAHNETAMLAALSGISDFIYVYDEQFRFIYGNQAMLDLWDAKLDELIGRPVRDLLHDEAVADQIETHIRQVVETGEPVFSETAYTSPTGATGYYDYIFRPFEHADGVWVVGSSRDVSERKRLADELTRKREELNEILESISDAFYAVDHHWRFTYLNEQATRLLRKDRGALLGSSIWDEFPEAVNTAIYSMYHRVMERQVPESLDFYYEPLETWFDVHAFPSHGYLSVYFRDINDQVRIQRELTASVRRYKTLTNAMPQMVWRTDADGRHLYFNDRWYAFTGLSETESLGYGFTNALHPADYERTVREWERAWQNRQPYEIEYRFYSRALGEYRWFLGRAFPVFDERGTVTEWVGTCTDIEPQKRAEARLVESERRLADAQRMAHIGNWELDLKTGNFSCSDEHYRIFGLDPADRDLDVRAFVEPIYPDDREIIRQQRDRVLEKGSGTYEVEFRIALPAGEERVLHTLAELVTDDNAVPERLIGTVHDITERKKIERALEEYSRQQTLLSRNLQYLNSTLEQQVEERTTELRALSEELESKVRARTAELESSRAELAYQARHDSLTDLPNRVLFEDRLEHAIASAERTGQMVAVLFIDLDGFKLVNDSFGHDAGDYILKQVGSRLLERVRRADTLARHGGDEFVVVLETIRHPDEAMSVALELMSTLNQPFDLAGKSIRLSASMGLALFPQDSQTVSGLQRLADVAMYRAKSSGKNDIRFYSPSMNAATEERLEIAAHLTAAIDRGELSLSFQPQLTLRSNRVESVEALLRWQNPTLGSVSPGRLIPIAEEVGLMGEISAWSLDESCRAASQLSAATGEYIRVAANVSASQLDRDDFVSLVEAIIRRHGILPGQLELELTESTVMSNIERSVVRLSELRALGVRIAMDDFGLGSSSLSNLVRLPLDTVKIDRAFIRDLSRNNAADRVVQAIVSLTGGIGLDVVAEGVETSAQRERVAELGCERLQGYYIGYPSALSEIQRLVKASRPPNTATESSA
jgi:diguanylate cyclase (GGDEF)-like protein/PAS domain S-box-containing protein